MEEEHHIPKIRNLGYAHVQLHILSKHDRMAVNTLSIKMVRKNQRKIEDHPTDVLHGWPLRTGTFKIQTAATLRLLISNTHFSFRTCAWGSVLCP